MRYLAPFAALFLAGQISGTAAKPFSVLHKFNGKDGNGPSASFLPINGLLYGTTYEGGRCSACGVLFAMDPVSGETTILHEFGKGDDAYFPLASLTDVGGTLYGTTYAGGAHNSGTVYAFDPQSGQESVIWGFRDNEKDGHYPFGAVIEFRGKLYGTTYQGGSDDLGTVFSLDPATRREKVLHAFASGGEDGNYPHAGLVAAGGVLYGTTAYGGNSSCAVLATSGCGVVFAITAGGRETVLYSFQNNSTDGEYPEASLIIRHGLLYGTTEGGGTYGSGTIFSLDPNTDNEKILYSFGKNRTNGLNPVAPLIELNGVFYGTTELGGEAERGTVFSFDPATGEEAATPVLQGMNVTAGVVAWNGILYGAALEGGKSGNEKHLCRLGCGLAFSVKP